MRDDVPTFIGPTYGSLAPTKQKILAADGIPGVIMMLAYYAGGHNLFPPSVDVPMYLIEEKLEGKKIRTDLNLMKELISRLSLIVGQTIGILSTGSFPVYLSQLRNGKRANRTGDFPKIDAQFRSAEGDLTIGPRNLVQDKSSGVWNLVPTWVRSLNHSTG